MNLAARSHTRYLEAIGVFCRHSRSGFVRSVGNAVALVSGAPEPEFNSVFVDGPRPLHADVRTAVRWIRDERLPHCVVIRSGVDDDLRPTAAEMGLDRDPWLGPLMATESAPDLAGSSGLVVRDGPLVDSTHRRLIAEGFGVDVVLVDAFIGPSFAHDVAVRIAVGSTLAGDPVVTGTAVVVSDPVCVFTVAPVEAHRGRGYGAAITAHLVADGLRRGATLAVLESSEAAISMYEKMGFSTVAHYERWRTR